MNKMLIAVLFGVAASCTEKPVVQQKYSINSMIDSLSGESIDKLIGVSIHSRYDDYYEYITINDTNNRPNNVYVQLDNTQYEDIFSSKAKYKYVGLVNIAKQRGYNDKDILDSMKEYTKDVLRIFKKSGAESVSTYPFHRCVLFEINDTTIIWVQYPNDTLDVELSTKCSESMHIKGNWYYFTK